MKEKLKYKKIIKSNKGFTMQDLVIAITIIIAFVGFISSLMYSAYSINIKNDLTTQMVTYSIQILEDIDKISFEEVNSNLAGIYKNKFSIPSGFNVKIDVSNYDNENNSTMNLIKIVNLSISYNLAGNEQQYNIKKLKIKEI